MMDLPSLLHNEILLWMGIYTYIFDLVLSFGVCTQWNTSGLVSMFIYKYTIIGP
jgi:hypothetical protein